MPFLWELLAGSSQARAPSGPAQTEVLGPPPHSGVSREERELAGAWCLPSRRVGAGVNTVSCPSRSGGGEGGGAGGAEGGSARARCTQERRAGL